MKPSRRQRSGESKGKPEDPSLNSHESPAPLRGRLVFIALFLGAAALVVFYPCLSNGFTYDDQQFLLDNFHFRGLGPDHLRWMFTTFHLGHYQPLAWITFGIDYLIWGGVTKEFHLFSVICHLVNIVFVFLLARRLIGLALPDRRDPRDVSLDAGAAVAALLFGLHPLRVESVAWVTDRNDVFSAFFLLVTLLCYLRAQQTFSFADRRNFLIAAVIAYFLSLLSRATGVTLPLILLALDVYPLRRMGNQRTRKAAGGSTATVWLEKTPFFLLAFCAGCLAPIAKRYAGSMPDLEALGALDRLAVACRGLVFYLQKSLWPVDLSPIYELRAPLDHFAPRFIIAAVLVPVLVGTVIVFRRRFPAVATATVAYALFLLPVLGLVQSGPQEVADRYSYLPSVGWAALLGGIVTMMWHNARRRVVAVTVAISLLAALGLLSRRQCYVWRDSLTLWSHAVQHGPPSATAHYNLACALVRSNDQTSVIDHFRKAIELNPNRLDAHYNLANYLAMEGRLDEAVAVYRRAIELDPAYGGAYFELGRVYARQGKYDDAIDAYRKAIEVAQTFIPSYINLGTILVDQKKQYAEAIALYRRALEVRPQHRDAHYNLGIALETAGDFAQAADHYKEAIRIDPTYANAHVNLGNCFVRKGLLDDALAEYQQALKLDPNHPVAKANLDGLLKHLKRRSP